MVYWTLQIKISARFSTKHTSAKKLYYKGGVDCNLAEFWSVVQLLECILVENIWLEFNF